MFYTIYSEWLPMVILMKESVKIMNKEFELLSYYKKSVSVRWKVPVFKNDIKISKEVKKIQRAYRKCYHKNYDKNTSMKKALDYPRNNPIDNIS